MGARVTLAQVAERSGYSPTAVSFVLSGREGTRISEKAAKKIRETADEMGYSPDPRARALRTGKSEAIGFISNDVIVTRYASAMVVGAVDRAEQADRVMLISESGGSRNQSQAIEALLERRVDGLLVGLMGTRLVEVPDAARSVPTIVVNGIAKGFPGIAPDEHAAGYEAARYLIDAGHRRIGLIGRPDLDGDDAGFEILRRRFEGIDRAMNDAGLSFAAEYGTREWEPAAGLMGAKQVIENHDVSALLCANDRLSFGAYQAAAQLGLSIPTDLSVMSFDDEQLAGYLTPGLTTMRLPYEEMGRFGTDWVLRQADAGVPPGKRNGEEFLVPMPLVERGSVARPGDRPSSF